MIGDGTSPETFEELELGRKRGLNPVKELSATTDMH